MLETAKDLILSNSMAVLATSKDNQPHCSLMTYLAREDARTIFMLTAQNSRKYSNILNNPRVSLLIDTRTRPGIECSSIKALTVEGLGLPVNEQRQEKLKQAMIDKHPHLEALGRQDGSVVLEIQAGSFLLLDGVSDAYFLDLNSLS